MAPRIGDYPGIKLRHRQPDGDQFHPVPIRRAESGPATGRVVCGTCNATVDVRVLDAAATRSRRRRGLALGLGAIVVALVVFFVQYFPAYLALIPLVAVVVVGFRLWWREDGVTVDGTPPAGHDLGFAPSPPDPVRPVKAILPALFFSFWLALGLFGFVHSLPHPSAPATCNNEVMSPGDVCQTFVNGSHFASDTRDYATMLTEARAYSPGGVLMGLLFTLVGLGGLTTVVLGLRAHRAATRARR